MFFLKVYVCTPLQPMKNTNFFYNGWKMVGNGWFVVGNRSKFGWLFLALFYKGERNIHDWILGGKKFRCACFWEGVAGYKVGKFQWTIFGQWKFTWLRNRRIVWIFRTILCNFAFEISNKNWEFFIVQHLQKSNKSTKCDPWGQNYNHLQR